MKDQLTILWLRPIKYLSERSIDNTLASHIWKIKGHYFGLGQSSICLKDQLTILRLGLIKHLSERSVDNTSVRKKISKYFLWKKIFFVKKYFLQKKYFYEKKIFFTKKNIFYKKIFFVKKNIFCEKKYFRQNLRKKIFFMKKKYFLWKNISLKIIPSILAQVGEAAKNFV